MAGGVGSTTRVAKTTIEQWAKGVSEETEKLLVLLALMKKKGRINYGNSGGQFRWVVRKKDHELKVFPDMTPVDFERVNTKENAFLPWRGYYLSDTITLREKLEQGGPEAMIKIFASREEVIRRAAARALADEFYKDGNATGNESRFHGIESFMGIAAQTNADIVATTHNDTYANLSTAVAGLDATADRLWTPVIVNTDHTPTAGQQTWADYADQYLREGIFRAKHGNGPNDKLDLVMLNRAAYVDLLNLLDDKERIQVSRGSGLQLTQLGFGDHVEVDGCAVMWDEAVPTTDSDAITIRGYGFTTGQMELKVLGPKGNKSLFSSKVTFNDSYRADNIFLHLLGNLKFNPRHFAKFADISAVAS